MVGDEGNHHSCDLDEVISQASGGRRQGIGCESES
jgi:hypothetical protein